MKKVFLVSVIFMLTFPLSTETTFGFNTSRKSLIGGPVLTNDFDNDKLRKLQKKFEKLVKTHLLPEYLEDDPNLKWGYTGSFKTGVVGNKRKPNYGQPIDLDDFDIDFWIKSDILYEIHGNKANRPKADTDFRDILSKTSGFEGLRPNKKGFSIKFLPK